MLAQTRYCDNTETFYMAIFLTLVFLFFLCSLIVQLDFRTIVNESFLPSTSDLNKGWEKLRGP